MNNSMHSHSLHYGKGNKELNEMYFAMSVRTFAFALLAIFIPIYLYNLGYSLRQIFFFYILYYLFSSTGEYISGRLVSRYGAKHILALSFPSMAFGLLFLLTLSTYHWPLWLLAISMAFSNGLFWVPYDDDFSKAKHKKTAGTEISRAAVFVAIFGALGPIIGGIVAEELGMNVLIVASIMLLLIAGIPIFKKHDIVKKRPLKMRAFLTKGNIKNAVAYGGYGFEDNASKIIWPFFIFLIVGSYKEVGFIATLSLLMAIAGTFFIGKLADRHSKRKILRLGTVMSFCTGIGRTLVSSVYTAYVAGILSAMSHIFVFIPFISKFFINADRDRRTEYIVGMEMGTDFMRAIYFLLLVISTFFLSNMWVLTFGIALGAAGVLLSSLINNPQKVVEKNIKVQKEIAKVSA